MNVATEETPEETTDDSDDDLQTFAIFGLYQDRNHPEIIRAVDKDGARAQYHAKFPGWAGTTLYVKSLDELIELQEVPNE